MAKVQLDLSNTQLTQNGNATHDHNHIAIFVTPGPTVAQPAEAGAAAAKVMRDGGFTSAEAQKAAGKAVATALLEASTPVDALAKAVYDAVVAEGVSHPTPLNHCRHLRHCVLHCDESSEMHVPDRGVVCQGHLRFLP